MTKPHRYAEGTTVDVSKTKAELDRYGSASPGFTE